MSSKKDIDYLSVDPEIQGQKIALLSFLPPKEMHDLEFSSPIKEILTEKVSKNKDEFISRLSDILGIEKTTLEDNKDLDTEITRFVVENASPYFIEQENRWKEDVKKGLMGAVKVRGVYDNSKEGEEEMNNRCEFLNNTDKHFHIFKGPVGYWLPFNQPVSTVKDVHYSEKKLNDIMKSFMKNKIQSELFEQKRQQEMREHDMKKELLENEPAVEITEEISDNIETTTPETTPGILPETTQGVTTLGTAPGAN